MKNNSVQFLLTSDSEFLHHAATTAASALANNPSSVVHWICDELSAEVRSRLHRMASNLSGKIVFYKADRSKCQHFFINKHASLANYYRLQAPSLLPSSIPRVIYIDADTIIRKNLAELFNIDLRGMLLAAVQDVLSSSLSPPLGLQSPEYFNSGVMIVPLEIWRTLDIENQLYRYLTKKSDSVRYWDQEALNAVVNGRWYRLSYSFNAQTAIYENPSLARGYAQTAQDPHIVHFSGSRKPWTGNLDHPLLLEYGLYRRKTPWSQYREFNYLWAIMMRKKHLAKELLRGLRSTPMIGGISDMVWKKTHLYKKRKTLFDETQERLRTEALRIEGVRRKILADIIEQSPSGCPQIMSGPFEGMMYLRKSHGSQLLPKLLGTYEQPIQNVVKDLIECKTLDTVVNIGCGEGYYAVGFARARPEVNVFAFDISVRAQSACRELAAANGVFDAIKVAGGCTASELENVLTNSSVILCDVEGAELEILDPTVAPKLITSEILVETHDFIRDGATETLISRFIESHAVSVLCDHRPETERVRKKWLDFGLRLNEEELTEAVNECRPLGMKWLHLVPLGAHRRL